MQSLIKELKDLWAGRIGDVQCMKKQKFPRMHAALLRIINDLLAYVVIWGKCRLASSCCIKNTPNICLKHGKKFIWDIVGS